LGTKNFLKSLYFNTVVKPNTLTYLSLHSQKQSLPKKFYKQDNCIEGCPSQRQRAMLFLRLDQAKQLLKAAKNLRERLVIRYFLYNGLSPMELSNARIEHLDPVNCTLYLPKRHWKKNCLANIDDDTVRVQIVYSENRTEGPLIRSRLRKRLKPISLWLIVKNIASRTNIPGKEQISPLILKRTFAREWLLPDSDGRRGCVGTLQKQFSHKHLWSTAHYLRFVMEDVKPNHKRMANHLNGKRVATEKKEEL